MGYIPKFNYSISDLEEMIPPSLGPHPFFERHPELRNAMLWVTAMGAAKVGWRTVVTNPTIFAIVVLVPAVAVVAGSLTVAGVEIVVGKKEARGLVEWYSLTVNVFNDPYAWHVETDRVVQGAAQHIIQGVVPGLLGVPEEVYSVTKPVGVWAYWKFWKSDEAQSGWREIGGGIGGGGSW